MAWEKRGSGKFYYRSERDADGRVRKRYLGAGDAARDAAAEDAQAQARQRAQRTAREDYQRVLGPTDAAVEELILGSDALYEAVLESKGYHRHRGAWRLKRERQTDNITEHDTGERQARDAPAPG